MKELRFFYVPQPEAGVLPSEEAQHAVRVLRLAMGDELNLMDGVGNFYRAVITAADNHHCRYRIEECLPQQPEWTGTIHLAVAPTKHMERMEWLVEKAMEVGFDRLSLLDCRFSERRVVKTDRLEKIVVAAMKQSHKAWKPKMDEMEPFSRFIKRSDLPAQRFIAHCYEESNITDAGAESVAKPFLPDVLQSGQPALVLVGPEGDFSIEEVREAIAAGFQPVSLGTSRLRTETAALVAVVAMRFCATRK